jgi:hypothetical protein
MPTSALRRFHPSSYLRRAWAHAEPRFLFPFAGIKTTSRTVSNLHARWVRRRGRGLLLIILIDLIAVAPSVAKQTRVSYVAPV